MADDGVNGIPSDPRTPGSEPASPSSRGAPFASSPGGPDDLPPFRDESEADALLVSLQLRSVWVEKHFSARNFLIWS